MIKSKLTNNFGEEYKYNISNSILTILVLVEAIELVGEFGMNLAHCDLVIQHKLGL